jgi:hypothetical protein
MPSPTINCRTPVQRSQTTGQARPRAPHQRCRRDPHQPQPDVPTGRQLYDEPSLRTSHLGVTTRSGSSVVSVYASGWGDSPVTTREAVSGVFIGPQCQGGGVANNPADRFNLAACPT